MKVMGKKRLLLILVILMYLIITAGLLYALYHYGDLSSPYFWIAVVVEIVFAYIAVFIVKTFYLKLSIVLTAIILPVILAGIFNSLKPIVITPEMFLLACICLINVEHFRRNTNKKISFHNIFHYMKSKWLE